MLLLYYLKILLSFLFNNPDLTSSFHMLMGHILPVFFCEGLERTAALGVRKLHFFLSNREVHKLCTSCILSHHSSNFCARLLTVLRDLWPVHIAHHKFVAEIKLITHSFQLEIWSQLLGENLWTCYCCATGASFKLTILCYICRCHNRGKINLHIFFSKIIISIYFYFTFDKLCATYIIVTFQKF